MEKLIKIAGRELPVHVSLKSLIDYKSTFGTDFFEDIDKIQNIDNNSIASLSSVINVSFQIIYILHKPYCKEKNFADFLDSFEFGVFQNTESLNEVVKVFNLLFPSKSKGESRSQKEGETSSNQ